MIFTLNPHLSIPTERANKLLCQFSSKNCMKVEKFLVFGHSRERTSCALSRYATTKRKFQALQPEKVNSSRGGSKNSVKGARTLQRGHQHTILPIFSKNLNEIENILVHRIRHCLRICCRVWKEQSSNNQDCVQDTTPSSKTRTSLDKTLQRFLF